MNRLRVVRVDESDLRRLFNEEGYWQQVRAGILTARLREDGHPSPERSGEPYCTRSQIIAYLDESGDEMALVHQYLRSDGTLGASGMPDLKRSIRVAHDMQRVPLKKQERQ